VAKAEAILAGLGPDGYVLQQFNNADNPKVWRRARECSRVDITRGAGTKHPPPNRAREPFCMALQEVVVLRPCYDLGGHPLTF
jgi:hypothetical protein